MRLIKYIFVFFVVIFLNSCKATSQSKKTQVQTAGIHFLEDDWNSALKQAKTENKLVFLDIYATWCGPCKMLKQYTFSNTSVGNYFNNNFVNISVDGEKGVGPQLAQQYSIEGYPSLIITDATGKPVLVTAGYMKADDLLKFAQEALKRKDNAKL